LKIKISPSKSSLKNLNLDSSSTFAKKRGGEYQSEIRGTKTAMLSKRRKEQQNHGNNKKVHE
jgi:hypothetical protein